MKNFFKQRFFSLKDLPVVAHDIENLLNDVSVLALSGPLGAGKTTLAQHLLKQKGIKGVLQSPTFSYVITYEAPNGMIYHHFDLYRLHSQDDFFASGFDEYLFQSGSKAIIEWPEVIADLLYHDTCFITLDYDGTEKRSILVRCT